MQNEFELKKLMCEIGRRVYNRGMVAANDGNFSVKLNDNEFLCTPTGVSKGFMTPEYICKVDAKGNVLQANGNFRPSSEIKMHMRVYEKRPDVNAVVHAHPSYATSFAIAGIPLTAPIMPEAVIALGCVPIAKYGTPSTMEIPDAVEEYLPYFDQVLLENHGALSWSTDLLSAYHKMESIEFYAELLYKSKMLGGPKEFDKEQIAKLKQKEKQLQDRKREMDDMEILKVTKKIGITPEQLKLLNNLSEKEIKNLLAEREMAKETGNLNTERKGDFYNGTY